MKNTRKALVALLLLMTILVSLAAVTIPASAANIPGGTKLYLVPSANWNQSNARFAAYFFGDGEAWVSMTKVAGQSNLYEVTVPAGKNFTNVIFCRMNPSASANNWNNKWNQTSDLTYNGTSNCYTVKEGTWDKGGGTWSTYGNACTHANVGPAATCTTAQVCNDCGDPVASALGHTYNSSHLCTRCNEQATFTVAGSGAHLGTEWDTGNTANDMTYADGVYTKVYTNVAAGSYLLKVARDHDWGTAYPSADKAYTVSAAGSTVTVTLKGTTVTVTVTAPHTHSYNKVVTEPTFEAEGYTTYTCSCGDSYVADKVPAKVAVATANGEKYETLAEALANGGEIVLLANIELDAPIVITGSYVIDLNGYTLSYTSEVMGEAMITNKGSLVINDSSDAKSGVINYNYVGANDASYGKGNYTISNSGNLTINGGKITIANLRQHAKYPIDNNSTTGDAILVINGGHLYNYNTSAIRMFCNSTTYKNSVTINGGLIEGYSAIWMQNPGSKTVHGSLEIKGGEIKTTAAAWVAGTAELKDVSSNLYTTIDGNGGAWSEDSFISLLGGIFNENVNIYYEAPANVTVGEDAQFNGNCYYFVPHVHSWSDATCTEPQKCECGETQGEALGHNYVEMNLNATCTTDGYNKTACDKCGDVIYSANVPAPGHKDENPADHECDVCGLSITDCVDENKDHKCDVCKDVMSQCADNDKNHFCDHCGVQNSHCIDIPPVDHICGWCGEKMSEHKYVDGKCECGAEDPNYVPPHEHSWSDATCTEPKKCECGETQGEALGHTWNNCECACGAVLPTLGTNESFDFTTAAGLEAALASGKLGYTGTFRNNGGSFQFNTNSSIQFIAPANSTVTITGHSAQYGVFNVSVNGEVIKMEGTLTFTVTEETKVVIATGDNGASYSYIKSIGLAEYVDRTISSDTTITFGSEGNYKNSIVDFSGIQIGDNGGNNSQVKNGSFDLILKGNMAVTIHGYPGYTSYKINDGEAIESEYYTIYTEGDTVLTITPVSGSNYFYSIEIKAHTHAWSDATCTEPSKCECGKTQGEALGHTWSNATCTAPKTCSVCNATEGDALGHTWVNANCTTPKTCSVCKATEGDALGHDIVVDAAVDATCTETGLTAGEHCTRCDHKVPQNVVPAVGHADENKDYTCDVCNADLCIDHVEENIAGKAATCTETGLTDGKKCANCGDILVAQEVIPALGHSHEAVITAPTCTAGGYTTYTCHCGDSYVADEVEALGHFFVEGKCECGAEDPNYLPPHEHNFVDGKCECGESDPNYVPPHEHNFVEGKCECGEEEPNYQPPEQGGDDTPSEPEAELNFFEQIIKAITDFFAQIGNWFKNLFAK